MATTISTNSKIVTIINTDELETVQEPIVKDRKHRFFARWLRDENFKLYCQWVIED